MNLYFVQSVINPNAPPPSPGVTVTILGYSFAIGGSKRHVFIADAAQSTQDKVVKVVAHELGHALGLTHNADHDPQNLNKLVRTDNPFINGPNDTDFEDKTSLMWWSEDNSGCHIGAPLWFQLNSANQQ